MIVYSAVRIVPSDHSFSSLFDLDPQTMKREEQLIPAQSGSEREGANSFPD